jgi:hypothetical protein
LIETINPEGNLNLHFFLFLIIDKKNQQMFRIWIYNSKK